VPFGDNEQGDLADVRQTTRMAADSNTDGPLWSTASCDAEAAQLADAYERR
jgi:hypothetical protein